MEINVVIELTRQELWDLIESLPENRTGLHVKLRGARDAFERRYQVYGNGAKISPSSVLEGIQHKLESGD
jgi:hypothetical protein